MGRIKKYTPEYYEDLMIDLWNRMEKDSGYVRRDLCKMAGVSTMHWAGLREAARRLRLPLDYTAEKRWHRGTGHAGVWALWESLLSRWLPPYRREAINAIQASDSPAEASAIILDRGGNPIQVVLLCRAADAPLPEIVEVPLLEATRELLPETEKRVKSLMDGVSDAILPLLEAASGDNSRKD